MVLKPGLSWLYAFTLKPENKYSKKYSKKYYGKHYI